MSNNGGGADAPAFRLAQRQLWFAVARQWRRVARNIAKRGLRSGLCREVQSLNAPRPVLAEMRFQLFQHVADHDLCVDDLRNRRGFWMVGCGVDETWMSISYLDKPGRAENRLLFCLLLAEEAKDAARSI